MPARGFDKEVPRWMTSFPWLAVPFLDDPRGRTSARQHYDASPSLPSSPKKLPSRNLP